MAYNNLLHFIEKLETANELVRIREYVNPHLEITDIYDRIVKKQGPALLFENTGSDFPLLINMMGSQKRICMALGVDDLDDIASDFEQLMQLIAKPKDNIMDKLKMLPFLNQISSWMPKEISGRGPCQEVVMNEPDITKFPIQTCWPEDGGPFITLPMVHTKDLRTGIRNVGMYRMQVFGPDLAAIHWQLHKISAQHFNNYKSAGEKMEVAIALGGDPVYTYSSTAPMPENIDEYTLAGFIRKKRVELVKCLTIDMYVPKDADIILEGYVDPKEDLILEGPFGDHTGYYSLSDYYPKFHITCITHRKNAIYPSTVVGIPPKEDGWIGKATERIFLAPIKMSLIPEIVDMELPVEGGFHNLAIAKINKRYSGQALKTGSALWGAGQMMLNKMMLIVDGEVDIHNYWEVARYISENVNPQTDIQFTKGPIDILDHAVSTMSYGGKMLIDGTKKTAVEKQTDKNNYPKLNPINKEDIQKQYPEITGINCNLFEKGISLMIISVKKNRKSHIRELNEQLFSSSNMQDIKMIIYLDPEVDIFSYEEVTWRFSNNIDPLRDHYLISKYDDSKAHIGIDGTRKTGKLDDFKRDWPNIVVMNKEVINQIDLKWDQLGLGEFIKSPSLKFIDQLFDGGAVVKE